MISDFAPAMSTASCPCNYCRDQKRDVAFLKCVIALAMHIELLVESLDIGLSDHPKAAM